jgi:hypothetical protein
MPYSASDLDIAIKQIIEQALSDGVEMPAASIALSVRARHPFPKTWKGEHSEFALLCTVEHVRARVHSVLGRMKNRPDPGAELLLPGFEYLQRGYIVERRDQLMPIRIDLMSDDELDAKADEYERMGAGCYKHAAEIRRYKAARKAAA